MGPSILTMLRTLSTRFPQGIRTMAAKAKKAPAAEAKIEAPVRLHGLDGRYASSLYCVAARKKQLEAVESDLKLLTGALGSSQALTELVNNPSIPKGAKVAAIEDLAKKAGFAESTNNLLALMAEHTNIADKYEELLRAARGQIFANVTVADELDKAQTKALEKSLSSFITKGQTLTMAVKVDTTILGGLVVEIGDKHVDLSIRSRIQKLTNELMVAI